LVDLKEAVKDLQKQKNQTFRAGSQKNLHKPNQA
jgi:hypothetical protein